MNEVGSLFSGCLGLDLGLEAAGWHVAWACENDPDCRRVIAHHRPDLRVIEDVRDVDATLPPVDLLAGGFPCTDLSIAGRRVGLRGDHSGLWHEFIRAIRELRPRNVLVENVPGLLSGGDWICVPCGFYGEPKPRSEGSWCPCCHERLDTRAEGTLYRSWMGVVLGDLAEAGYDARWLCVRASDLGAPHRRERVFIVARSAAADAGSGGVGPDGRVRGGNDRGGSEPEPAALPSGAEVVRAADAQADRADAAADAERDPERRPQPGEVPRAARAGEGEGAQRERVRPDAGDGGEAAADADGSGQREHGGPVAVREELGPVERGGGEAAADPECVARPPAGERLLGPGAGGGRGVAVGGATGRDRVGGAAAADAGLEPGQPGVGRRVEGGDPSRPGPEERDRDGHVGEAERGQAVEAAADADDGRDGEGARTPRRETGEREPERPGLGRDSETGGVEWGAYGPAVQRWEYVIGRPAPRPTDDKGRLSSRFVEWMLGFPDGWVEVAGVKRTAQLRMLGNAVQVDVGYLLGTMIRDLDEAT